jgi:hypothetical protein
MTAAMTPIKVRPAPVKPIKVREPSQVERKLREDLHQDARTHLGRMFAPPKLP